jgi:hypothetical protein
VLASARASSMIHDPDLTCGSCGASAWRLERTGNDEPLDPHRDWRSVLSVVCRECGAAAVTLSSWYDGTFEVEAFGDVVAATRPPGTERGADAPRIAPRPTTRSHSGLVCCVCGRHLRDGETHKVTPAGPAHLACLPS